MKSLLLVFSKLIHVLPMHNWPFYEVKLTENEGNLSFVFYPCPSLLCPELKKNLCLSCSNVLKQT